MKWLRLYHAVVDSVAVRTLPEPAQLDWFLLLCVAGEYRAKTGKNTGETGLTIAQAMWRLRRDAKPGTDYPTLEGTFPAIAQNGLAHVDAQSRIVLDDWLKYQFPSDDVTPRTKKTKQKKKGNVPGNTVRGKSGVLDTDTDTDTDTESSTTHTPVESAGAEAPLPTPRRASRLADEWVCPEAWLGWSVEHCGWTHEECLQVALKFRNWWTSKAGQGATKLNWERVWMNWCMREHEQRCAGHGGKIGARERAAKSYRETGDEQPDETERDITGEARRVA